MKTPREILFEKHQEADARLDAIRQQFITSLNPTAPHDSVTIWLRSLRWHFAGLVVAWCMILMLHLANPENPNYQASEQKSASPAELEVALRENRRQLVELMTPPISTALPTPADRRPRSAIETSNQLA